MNSPNTLLLILAVLTSRFALQDGGGTSSVPASDPPPPPSTLPVEEAHVSILLHLNGYLFEDKVLFDLASLSPIHCAHACLTSPQCVMFTMTPSSSSSAVPWGQCRGHSAVMRSGNDASQHVLGSHVFILKERAKALSWLNRSCETDSTCPATLSTCFSSRCLCRPGYYYSISGDACVDGCDKGRLQWDFLAYPGSSLMVAETRETRQPSSLQRCLDLCRADRHCRTFDLHDGHCTTHYVTSRASPRKFTTVQGSASWHFQRMCA